MHPSSCTMFSFSVPLMSQSNKQAMRDTIVVWLWINFNSQGFFNMQLIISAPAFLHFALIQAFCHCWESNFNLERTQTRQQNITVTKPPRGWEKHVWETKNEKSSLARTAVWAKKSESLQNTWHNGLKSFIEILYHKTIQSTRLQAKKLRRASKALAGFNNASKNSLMECKILDILYREWKRRRDSLGPTSCK